MAAKATLVLALLAALAQVIKPGLSFIGKVMKVIAELFRPINDVIILLLRPVLAIMRPLLMIMRSIMLPFRRAAIKLSSSGMKDIAEGIKNSDASKFGLGIVKSILSVETIMTGFSAAAYKVLLNVYKLLLIGLWTMVKFIMKGIFLGIASVQSASLLLGGEKGAKRTLGIGGTLAGVGDALMESSIKSLDLILDKFIDMQINRIKKGSEILGVNLDKELQTTMDEISIKDILGVHISNVFDVFKGAGETIAEILSRDMDDAFELLSFSGVFDTMAENTATEFKKSIEDKFKGLFDVPKDTRGGYGTGEDYQTPLESFSEGAKSTFEESREWMVPTAEAIKTFNTNTKESIKSTFGETGSINTDMSKGNVRTLKVVNSFFGEKGSIQRVYGGGLSGMLVSAELFSTQISKVGDTLVARANEYARKIKEGALQGLV